MALSLHFQIHPSEPNLVVALPLILSSFCHSSSSFLFKLTLATQTCSLLCQEATGGGGGGGVGADGQRQSEGPGKTIKKLEMVSQLRDLKKPKPPGIR